MESSDLAGNAVTFLHDEDYAERYLKPRLGHATLINVSGREPIDLNGDWAFTLDLFDTGLRQRWFTLERDHQGPTDYDPYDSDTLLVPSVWNLARPQWFHFEGGAWYTRLLDRPDLAQGDRLVLRIGAANYLTRIFLNGIFLGSHAGGSTPFCCDLTDTMQEGENRLMLYVENRRSPTRAPSHHIDWFNYGGIHRDVALYRLPTNHISDATIRWSDTQGIVVDVQTSGAGGTVEVRIPELDLYKAASVEGQETQLVLGGAPELWSPANPKLYDVEIGWKGDSLIERTGFRSIQLQGREILLNGEPLFLRGICVHEDDVKTGRVTSPDQVRAMLMDAKALGCNFIRLAHYPHSDVVARLADEMGMLLWAEIPVYWSLAFDNPETLADTSNQLGEMIKRDRNRPSVLCWGLANETPDTDERLGFLTSLANTARSLDTDRPLAAACLFDQADLTIRDRLADLVDIVGVNEYFGWYDSDADDLTRLLQRYDLDKPLIISETGCDIKAGLEGDATVLGSEAFGVAYFSDQIERMRANPVAAGFCPWLLYDFRTERRQNRLQQGWNLKGLMASDKTTRKAAFNTVRAFYQERMANGRA
ncbi:MAG: glycoside hydrolase family 2 protein [Hyphomicrobiales bacterium]